MTSHKDAITNLLSSYNGVTTLFLEDVVRDVDIGVHDFEIGNPQKVSGWHRDSRFRGQLLSRRSWLIYQNQTIHQTY